MKIWIDDILPAPDESYRRCHSVLQAQKFIEAAERAQTIPWDTWRNPDDINKFNIEKISIRYSISLDYMAFFYNGSSKLIEIIILLSYTN